MAECWVCFFFGLAIGGYLATLQSRSSLPAILRLSGVEALIALLALPAAFLPLWTDWIWTAIGTDALVSWQGSAIKLLISILVVMPPAIAMGFTLPLFIRSATELGANVASVGVWIYSLNTLGGVFGLWFTSTCLVGWFGAQWAMLVASATNGLVAMSLCFLLISTNRRSVPLPKSNRKQTGTDRDIGDTDSNSRQSSKSDLSKYAMTRWQLLYLSFASGFVVLSLEVLLLRLISLVVPSSYHTTSALLANVILILAVSSGLISLSNSLQVTRNLGKSRWLLAGALGSAAIFVCLCPVFLFELTDKLISVRYIQGLNGRTIDSINHYWMLVFWLIASAGGLALLCSGLVFPSLLTMSSDQDPAGKKVGMLLAVNGIGGLLGAEFFNSVVIEAMGVYQGFVLLAGLMVFVCALTTFNANRTLTLSVTCILSIVVFVGYTLCGDLPYLSPRATNGLQVKASHFGKDGVWLVVDKPTGSTGIMVNNQYFLGGSGAMLAQRRQLLLPWILKPDAKSVCCLGLATGITASGLEQLEDPPPITAVELSGNVVKLAKQYFEKETDGFFDRKDNQVVVEDARTFVSAANDQYDVIVGDLYRPHGTGEGRLYSLEHFQNVRQALTADGIYCQWLPIYQLNDENWQTIAATFQKIFPETLVLYGDLDVRFPVLGLIGSKESGMWQADRMNQLLNRIPADVLERDPLLKNARSLLVGVLNKDQFKNTRINTLDNLQVEISAGNFWILKDLRKNRTQVYENEFLSKQHLMEFNERLGRLSNPVFSRDYFDKLQQVIKSQVNK